MRLYKRGTSRRSTARSRSQVLSLPSSKTSSRSDPAEIILTLETMQAAIDAQHLLLVTKFSGVTRAFDCSATCGSFITILRPSSSTVPQRCHRERTPTAPSQSDIGFRCRPAEDESVGGEPRANVAERLHVEGGHRSEVIWTCTGKRALADGTFSSIPPNSCRSSLFTTRTVSLSNKKWLRCRSGFWQRCPSTSTGRSFDALSRHLKQGQVTNMKKRMEGNSETTANPCVGSCMWLWTGKTWTHSADFLLGTTR